MAYEHSSERIRTPEALREERQRADARTPSLTRERVEHACAARRAQLAALEDRMPAPLLEALCAKLEYERAQLAGFAQEDERARIARERAGTVLDTRYFVRKRLKHHLL